MSQEQNSNAMQNSLKSSPGSSTNSNSERDEDVKKSNGSGKSFGESDDENMSGFDSDSEDENSKNNGKFNKSDGFLYDKLISYIIKYKHFKEIQLVKIHLIMEHLHRRHLPTLQSQFLAQLQIFSFLLVHREFW